MMLVPCYNVHIAIHERTSLCGHDPCQTGVSQMVYAYKLRTHHSDTPIAAGSMAALRQAVAYASGGTSGGDVPSASSTHQALALFA